MENNNNRFHRLSFAETEETYAGSNSGVRTGQTNLDLRDITNELLAALIENEINSAFIFVSVARTAYREAQFSEGNAALSKAEAIYAQASALARDTGTAAEERRLAIADRLRELRLALDALITSGVSG